MVIKDSALIFSQPGMLPEKALADLVAQARTVDMEQVRKKLSKAEADKAKTDSQASA